MSTVPVSVRDELRGLRDFYDDVAARLEAADEVLFSPVPSVSSWSPAQHVYHILRANASMLKAASVLASGRSGDAEPTLTEAGRRVLEAGTIPRGVATAPKNVRPPDDLDRATLEEMLARSREKLDAVADEVGAVEAADGAFPHPAWGGLTAAEWVRAARVHSDHHAAILDDVYAARAGDEKNGKTGPS